MKKLFLAFSLWLMAYSLEGQNTYCLPPTYYTCTDSITNIDTILQHNVYLGSNMQDMQNYLMDLNASLAHWIRAYAGVDTATNKAALSVYQAQTTYAPFSDSSGSGTWNKKHSSLYGLYDTAHNLRGEVKADYAPISTVGDSGIASSSTIGSTATLPRVLTLKNASTYLVGSDTTGSSAKLVTLLGLHNFTGTTNITTLGTIGTGVWNGTRLTSSYIPTDVDYTDVQQAFTKSKAVTPYVLADGSTVSVDLSQSNNFVLPLTGNHNLGVPTNPLAGQTGWLDVYQDGTGSRTLFGSPAWCYTAAGGTFPTLTTTALARDKLTYTVDYYKTASVTCTSAAPGVVTYTAHGMQSGDRFAFTSGTAPTGTSLNTLYFITVIDANTFKLSSSYANFQSGTFITTSSTGSTLIGTFLSVTIGTSCLNCQ